MLPHTLLKSSDPNTKERDAPAKFGYKTYCFLTFSSPSASLDLKVPIFPRGQCVLDHVARVSLFFSDTSPKCLDRDCVGRRHTENRHGNVYRYTYTVAPEKNRELLFRQIVLQTVTSLRVVSLEFRRNDLLKITNINPQQEARFSLWKKTLALGLKCVWGQSSRKIINATIRQRV